MAIQSEIPIEVFTELIYSEGKEKKKQQNSPVASLGPKELQEAFRNAGALSSFHLELPALLLHTPKTHSLLSVRPKLPK